MYLESSSESSSSNSNLSCPYETSEEPVTVSQLKDLMYLDLLSNKKKTSDQIISIMEYNYNNLFILNWLKTFIDNICWFQFPMYNHEDYLNWALDNYPQRISYRYAYQFLLKQKNYDFLIKLYKSDIVEYKYPLHSLSEEEKKEMKF